MLGRLVRVCVSFRVTVAQLGVARIFVRGIWEGLGTVLLSSLGLKTGFGGKYNPLTVDIGPL